MTTLSDRFGKIEREGEKHEPAKVNTPEVQDPFGDDVSGSSESSFTPSAPTAPRTPPASQQIIVPKGADGIHEFDPRSGKPYDDSQLLRDLKELEPLTEEDTELWIGTKWMGLPIRKRKRKLSKYQRFKLFTRRKIKEPAKAAVKKSVKEAYEKTDIKHGWWPALKGFVTTYGIIMAVLFAASLIHWFLMSIGVITP